MTTIRAIATITTTVDAAELRRELQRRGWMAVQMAGATGAEIVIETTAPIEEAMEAARRVGIR